MSLQCCMHASSIWICSSFGFIFCVCSRNWDITFYQYTCPSISAPPSGCTQAHRAPPIPYSTPAPPSDCTQAQRVPPRVSSETSFTSKQPNNRNNNNKLYPKLVLALFETKPLVWLFCFFIQTASFGVLIEPKQEKTNRNTDCRQLIMLIPICELSIWNFQWL